jgi:polyphosphate kinase 2 (PPK2 family)
MATMSNLDAFTRSNAERDADIQRFMHDLVDSYDEELELEIDDGESGGMVDREARRLYFRELFRLQGELVKLQDWVQHTKQKVVILFEGRDAAGKGGVIKRITQRLNPRVARVAALPAPNDRERTQWYFQRYIAHLPAAGEMVLFDRSWYNRAGVERVMGFCSDEEYEEFFRTVPDFERMLVRSGTVLIKYWFSITDDAVCRSLASRGWRGRVACPAGLPRRGSRPPRRPEGHSPRPRHPRLQVIWVKGVCRLWTSRHLSLLGCCIRLPLPGVRNP